MRALIIILSLLYLSSGAVVAEDSLTTLDFFQFPTIQNPALSPDGKRLAYGYYADNNNYINILDLETGDFISVILIQGEIKNRLRYLAWATPDRLIYKMERGSLWAVNTDGSKFKRLGRSMSGAQVRHLLRDDQDHIIIRVNGYHLINIHTGKRKRLFENIHSAYGYILDKNGEVRAGVEGVESGSSKIKLLYREPKGKSWKSLDKFLGQPNELTFSYTGKTASLQRCRLLAFDYDPNIVYFGSNIGGNTICIYSLNLATKEKELIAEHKTYDLEGRLYFCHMRRRLVGFTFHTERRTTVWLEPYFQQVQDTIDQSLQDRVNVILNWSDDSQVFLVFSYTGHDPGRYYVLNLKKQVLEEIGARHPQLDPEKLSPVYPFTVEARDGLVLQGYLTVPKSAKSLGLPIVIYPHGGPWVRDYYGYDPVVQFLAYHGYAVIQVNYRGSTGYGFTHFDAARKDYGKGINNDIIDTVRWAIENGMADPKRVAIMGFSYGGYATMNALTSEPDLFRCGVAMAGIYNVPLFMQMRLSEGSFYAYEYWKEMIGDPRKEKDKLREISPYYHIDRLRAPVFIYHGKEDHIVSMRQAQLLEKALNKAGKESKYMIMPGVGHGFWNYNYRYFDFEKKTEVYDAVLAFLDKHMK